MHFNICTARYFVSSKIACAVNELHGRVFLTNWKCSAL